MPNLIKQGEAKVLTKNGEVFVNITLELNIKLDNSNFKLINEQSPQYGVSSNLNKEEKVNWEIPEFESPNKIQFGKNE